jgi:hypothetical protein
MLSHTQQQHLKAGDLIKVDGEILPIDHAGITANDEPYFDYYTADGPYRVNRDDPRLSRPTSEEILDYKQKQLDRR